MSIQHYINFPQPKYCRISSFESMHHPLHQRNCDYLQSTPKTELVESCWSLIEGGLWGRSLGPGLISATHSYSLQLAICNYSLTAHGLLTLGVLECVKCARFTKAELQLWESSHQC